MKKRLWTILPLALVGLCITGCGNNGGGTDQETGFVKEKTEISFWTTFDDDKGAIIKGFIDEFKKTEPNVTVNYLKQSGSYNDIATMAQSGFVTGNYPDLIVAYPDSVANFIDYDKALNLEPLISNASYGWTSADTKDILPGYLAEGSQFAIDGTYCLPFAKSTEELYFNEDVLLGLDLSKFNPSLNSGDPINQKYMDNLTWTELFDNFIPALEAYNATLSEAEKILKTDSDYHSWFAYDSDDNMFITLAQQFGYGYTSIDAAGNGKVEFNNDELKALCKKFNEYAKKGYVMTKGSAGGNYTNLYFTKQSVLMGVSSTAGAKYYFDETNATNVGIARIPQADLKKPTTINQGPSLAALDHNDDNRALATWLFSKFMLNKQNSLKWSLNANYMPIRNSGYESEEYAEAYDSSTKQEKTLERLYAKVSEYLPKIVGNLYSSPAFKGSSEARQQAGGLMTKVLTTTSNIEDIDQWFKDAESIVKTAL